MRAAEQEFREAPRRQRRLSRRGVGLRTLLAVLLVLLVATSALGLALFTGAISIAQQPPVPEPNPSTAVSSAPQTAAAPTPEAARPKVTKQQTYGDWIYVCVESTQG